MDSLTQIVLGAAVGEAALGKKVGNKALLWGAIAGTIPDLDVILMRSQDLITGLDLHRGFSHSIAFSVLLAPLLGWLVSKLHRKAGATWKQWSWLFFFALVTHPMLDNFTTWGTEFFWPVVDYKVAFNSIFVVDPLYTVPFLVVTVWLMFLHRTSRLRKRLNYFGLIYSTAYLMLGLVNKSVSNNHFEEAFAQQKVQVDRYMTKPTPLNIVLWNVIAETKTDFVFGFSAITDGKDYKIPLKHVPKGHELIEQYRGDEQLEKLIWLTKNYFIVEQESEDKFRIYDLRFGMNRMVLTDDVGFIFTYYMTVNEDGSLHFSQGQAKFPDMGKAIEELWERMKGRV